MEAETGAAETSAPEPVQATGNDIDAEVEAAWDQIEGDEYTPDESDAQLAADRALGDPDIQPDPGEKVAEEPVQAEPTEAPNSWGTDAKDEWAKLPPEMQDVVAARESQREAHFTQKQQELSTGLTEVDNIRQAVKPYSQAWREEGLMPSQVIGEWLEFGSRMDANPQAGLQWLAEQYGISTHPNGQQQTNVNGYTGAPQANPVYDQRIATLEQTLNGYQQQAANAQEQQLEAEIKSFGSSQTEAGELAFPYLEEVAGTMEGIIPGIMAQGGTVSEVLQKAYAAAVAIDPEIGKKIAARTESQKVDGQKQKAAKAMRAAVSPKSNKGGNFIAPDEAPDDAEDHVRKVWDMLSGE